MRGASGVGFGAPTQWKIPVGLLMATLVAVVLLLLIGVIWFLTWWS